MNSSKQERDESNFLFSFHTDTYLTSLIKFIFYLADFFLCDDKFLTIDDGQQIKKRTSSQVS